MTSVRVARTVAGAALMAGLALSGCSSAIGEEVPSPAPSASQSTSETPSAAPDGSQDLQISGVWVKESSLDLSAGYGTITNSGTIDDALVAVSSPGVPVIEFHETTDAVMRQVESMPIPAGGTLELAPGGNHLMLIGLTEPLEPGDQIELELSFQSGSTASVSAPVRPFTDDGHGH